MYIYGHWTALLYVYNMCSRLETLSSNCKSFYKIYPVSLELAFLLDYYGILETLYLFPLGHDLCKPIELIACLFTCVESEVKCVQK